MELVKHANSTLDQIQQEEFVFKVLVPTQNISMIRDSVKIVMLVQDQALKIKDKSASLITVDPTKSS